LGKFTNQLEILLVDDDRHFAESLADVLRLRGSCVETVFSGEEAVSHFAHRPRDVVLLDAQLPGINGLETILQLQKIDPRPQFFLITGYDIPSLLDKIVVKGNWTRLRVPITSDSLSMALSRIGRNGLLMIGNTPETIGTLHAAFKQLGKLTQIARTDAEAFLLVSEGNTEVLVLDTGSSLLESLLVYLELYRRGLAIPVVLCTAFRNTVETGEIEQNLKILGILTKPFDPGKLLKALEGLVAAG
jgi:DNA-binding NtrC family response regulator